MKCTNCGGECRIAPEQVGLDKRNMPVYHRYAYCDKCMIKWDVDVIEGAKKSGDAKPKKYVTKLCIIACVLCGVVWIIPMPVMLAYLLAIATVILSIVDLSISPKESASIWDVIVLIAGIIQCIYLSGVENYARIVFK